MRLIRPLLTAAGLLMFVALPAAAHHIAEVSADIAKRDMFFQPVDQVAPGFQLEAADGKKVNLRDFRGKIVVLDFIYSRCKDVCPVQSELLASIQQQIDRTPMKGLVEFVSVATDTEDAQETAAIMRGYGAKHGLDPVNWVFLYRGAGAPDAGIKAAAAYGLKFDTTENGDQMHGVVTHVIDQAGHLRARFHGLKFDPTDLILFVNALTNEPPGGSGAAKASAVANVAAPPLWFEALLVAIALAIAVPAVLLVRTTGKR